MSVECPICGDTFEDLRGGHGHLRFAEGLEGEELEEAFEQMKTSEVTSPKTDGTEANQYSDPRMQAVENLRVAKKRLQEAKDRKEALRDSSGGGMVAPMTTWQEVKNEVVQKCDEEISKLEEVVEKRKEKLDKAIETEVNRRG